MVKGVSLRFWIFSNSVEMIDHGDNHSFRQSIGLLARLGKGQMLSSFDWTKQ